MTLVTLASDLRPFAIPLCKKSSAYRGLFASAFGLPWRTAVDKTGNTIDFLLCKNRDKKAAKRFFKKSIGSSGLPVKSTIDKSGANKSALDTINDELKKSTVDPINAPQILIRQIKYLNNIVEQDHRFIKKIVKPKLWFKEFHSAKATLAGIELHHMLKKGQHVNDENMTVFEQFYALAG